MKVAIDKTHKIQVKYASDIYKIMRSLLMRENKLRRKQEYFWVIALDDANKVENIELIALGAGNRVAAHPVDILSIPAQKRCKHIILVHNHPGGSLKPSAADITFTKKMIKAAATLNMTIYDHVIITEKSWFSFMDSGTVKF